MKKSEPLIVAIKPTYRNHPVIGGDNVVVAEWEDKDLINKADIFLQTSTPKLDPSLIGFITTGNEIFFFVKSFLSSFVLNFFLLIDKKFGVLILFFINIFFDLILFIALYELITPECV